MKKWFRVDFIKLEYPAETANEAYDTFVDHMNRLRPVDWIEMCDKITEGEKLTADEFKEVSYLAAKDDPTYTESEKYNNDATVEEI